MKASILIVDDNQGAAGVIAQAIQELRPDWKPLAANSCTEARETCKSMVPSAVVVDVNLPDGNGFDLLAELRRLEPRLPVIMIASEAGNFGASRNGHPCLMIEKPFDTDHLIQSVEKEINSACLVSQGRNPETARSISIRPPRVTALARRDTLLQGFAPQPSI
jgi:DNA-binding NtrC family response regulator